MLSANLETFWSDSPGREELHEWIRRGFEEDRVLEDAATAALFPENSPAVWAKITAQADGVLAGSLAAVECFRVLYPDVEIVERVVDGSEVSAGQEVLRVALDPRSALRAERTALNILSHLSGIATRVRSWTKLAPGVDVLDTRKTLPGLRRFQKYAVRCGAGKNHRFDLAEFPMVKENHRELFRAHRFPDGVTPGDEIAEIVRRVRERAPDVPLEIEVEDEASFRACLEHGVDLILIDNQTPETIREWLERAREWTDSWNGELEASGGITGADLAEYGRTGVRRISIGALTHSVEALDFSLHMEWVR